MPVRPFLVGAAGVAVAIGGVVLTLLLIDAAKGEGTCDAYKQTQNLSSDKPSLWSLQRPARSKRISIALDDYVSDARTGSGYVVLRRTKRNRRNAPLRADGKVGAFVLGGSLSSKTRGLGFTVFARGTRGADGRTIHVRVCARRPDRRSATRPGRYTGVVRVAGQRMRSVDVPLVLTIKAARTETALFALLIAIIGAALGAANSKPADVTAEEVQQKRWRHLILSLVPFATGLIAGLVAALIVYADDPTFGAERGADTAKLLAATFAAATSGLTVAAAPSRGLRKQLTR